jgi:hypothetical protein
VNVVKHQTKPERPDSHKIHQPIRATSFHFSYKQGFSFLNICSFLSISLSRSEIHDRLPGTFVFGRGTDWIIQLFKLKMENHTTRITPRKKKFHSSPNFLLLPIRSSKGVVESRQSSGREGGMKWGGAAVKVEGVGGGVQRYGKKEKVGHSFGRRTIRETGREGYARDEER